MAVSTAELLDQLNSRNSNTRRMAAYQLEKTGDRALSEILVPKLNDPNHYVRMAIARALGKVGDENAVPALLEAINDEVRMVGQTAIWSLGELGTIAEGAKETLEKLGDDPTPYAERELTFGELATIAAERIELALLQGDEPEAGAGGGELSGSAEQERLARRKKLLEKFRAHHASK